MRAHHGRPVVVALLLAALAGAAGCAQARAEGPGGEGAQPLPLITEADSRSATPSTPRVLLDDVPLPAVPDGVAPMREEVGAAAHALTTALDDDPRFGNVALEADGLVVHWHGEPAPELTDLIAQHGGVDVRVQQTPYLPGDVEAAAERIIAEVAGITLVGPEPDYSGLTVGVDPTLGLDPDDLARELEERYGIPVTVEEAEVAPAGGSAPDRVPPPRYDE